MKKKIPLSIPDLKGDVKKYLIKAIDENWVSSAAPGVKKFEKKISKIASCKYSIATITGSAALHLALKTLNIGKGNKVIVPDFTFAATINAVELSGAEPVIVDINKQDWTIDIKLLKEAINKFKPSAIVVVHTLGHPADMNSIIKLKKQYKIKVIEDAAGAMGAKYYNKNVGCLTDLGIFSFNGNKVLTTGSGGALLTNSKYYFNKATLLSNQGKKNTEYNYITSGYNYKMSNINASLGLAQIKHFNKTLNKKRKITKNYDNAFKKLSKFSIIPRNNDFKSSCWLYPLKMQSKKDALSLISFLKKKNIETRLFWSNLSSQKPYKKYTSIISGVAKELSSKVVTLPSSTNLSDKDQKAVIKSVLNWVNNDI